MVRRSHQCALRGLRTHVIPSSFCVPLLVPDEPEREGVAFRVKEPPFAERIEVSHHCGVWPIRVFVQTEIQTLRIIRTWIAK
jgi:hypothetical protein